MKNTSMQCNATKASRGRLRNSNWHLQWFPDGEAGTIKTHFDGSCQLGPDTDSAWQAETGNWCGETGAAILGSVMRHLTGFNIFSWVGCISVGADHDFDYFDGIGAKIKTYFGFWMFSVKFENFAETNYISDSSHPYLSAGQLGENFYDNWKLRSDFNLRRWECLLSEMSSLNRMNVFPWHFNFIAELSGEQSLCEYR